LRVLAETAAAVVIDIQEKLFPHISEHESLKKNCQILLAGLGILELPVVITEQYSKGLGPTIAAISKTITDFKPIEKMSFSCCGEPSFLSTLQKIGKRYILICGIEAHVCVLQTVIDLIERGYHPVVIEDCVSSRKSSDRETALKRFMQEGAIVTSYESILFELCRSVASEKFKAISKLVK
jgi:nicotinamidase-related amidase